MKIRHILALLEDSLLGSIALIPIVWRFSPFICSNIAAFESLDMYDNDDGDDLLTFRYECSVHDFLGGSVCRVFWT